MAGCNKYKSESLCINNSILNADEQECMWDTDVCVNRPCNDLTTSPDGGTCIKSKDNTGSQRCDVINDNCLLKASRIGENDNSGNYITTGDKKHFYYNPSIIDGNDKCNNITANDGRGSYTKLNSDNECVANCSVYNGDSKECKLNDCYYNSDNTCVSNEIKQKEDPQNSSKKFKECISSYKETNTDGDIFNLYKPQNNNNCILSQDNNKNKFIFIKNNDLNDTNQDSKSHLYGTEKDKYDKQIKTSNTFKTAIMVTVQIIILLLRIPYMQDLYKKLTTTPKSIKLRVGWAMFILNILLFASTLGLIVIESIKYKWKYTNTYYWVNLIVLSISLLLTAYPLHVLVNDTDGVQNNPAYDPRAAEAEAAAPPARAQPGAPAPAAEAAPPAAEAAPAPAAEAAAAAEAAPAPAAEAAAAEAPPPAIPETSFG